MSAPKKRTGTRVPPPYVAKAVVYPYGAIDVQIPHDADLVLVGEKIVKTTPAFRNAVQAPWMSFLLADEPRIVCNAVGAIPPTPNDLRCAKPIPMHLWCPGCGERHVDRGQWETRVHHTHACQNCGQCWRPAVVPTVGVMFLPGFKDS